jgi:hypothetical protein
VVSVPNILYVDAVDIGPKTFPMEIYWSGGRGFGGPIDPTGSEELEGRYEEYLTFHSIKIDDLKKFGTNPKDICEAMNSDLAGRTVYVERVDWTRQLITELYVAAKIDPADFTLSSLNEFLLQNLGSESILAALEKKASDYVNPIPGAFRFLYLRRLCELVFQESVS